MKLLYFIKYNMTGKGQKKSSKSGISNLRTAELEKFANTLRSKKQYGGSSHEVSGVEESWDLVNNLLNNSAPIDLGPPRKVTQSGGKRRSKKSYSLYGGGEESSGATFLPAQWNNAKAPLAKPNNPSQIESAYGKINAVSGMDVNLAAFPNSSMQQTGGAKKLKTKKATKATKVKKTKKSTDSSKDKPATKKAKKAKKSKKTTDSPKKSTSIWAKIKSFF
jgi:hypothetical protein